MGEKAMGEKAMGEKAMGEKAMGEKAGRKIPVKLRARQAGRWDSWA
jgi:hypothetical protein